MVLSLEKQTGISSLHLTSNNKIISFSGFLFIGCLTFIFLSYQNEVEIKAVFIDYVKENPACLS